MEDVITKLENESNQDHIELSTEELDAKLKKLRKKIGFEVAEEIDTMSTEDLKRRIVRSQVNMADTKASMERDEDLAKAKEQLAWVKSPYATAMNTQRAIAEYATLRLKEKT